LKQRSIGLENLEKNLCLQLEEELNLHEFLEPVEAFHHIAKVLLLNQMIAEEFFVKIHEALNISCDLKEMDHDLARYVTSLEMSQKDFTSEEWNFLRDGKNTRFLTRYPASHALLLHKETPLSRLVQGAEKLNLEGSFERSKGFENVSLPKKKFDLMKSVVVKDIELLTSILNKVLKKWV
jgi:hypothetical protein